MKQHQPHTEGDAMDEQGNMTTEEIKEDNVRRINTGCLYTKIGQPIVIISDPDQDRTHFIDIARMVTGTIKGSGLTDQQVVIAYMNNEYSYLKMDMQARTSMESGWEKEEFIDVSSEYLYY